MASEEEVQALKPGPDAADAVDGDGDGAGDAGDAGDASGAGAPASADKPANPADGVDGAASESKAAPEPSISASAGAGDAKEAAGDAAADAGEGAGEEKVQEAQPGAIAAAAAQASESSDVATPLLKQGSKKLNDREAYDALYLATKRAEKLRSMRMESRRTMTTSPWQKVFDPSSSMFYYWNPSTQETVWDQPEDYTELPMHPMLDAVLTIQQAGRRMMAGLRVSLMRRERAKRAARQREKGKNTTVEDGIAQTFFNLEQRKKAEAAASNRSLSSNATSSPHSIPGTPNAAAGTGAGAGAGAGAGVGAAAAGEAAAGDAAGDVLGTPKKKTWHDAPANDPSRDPEISDWKQMRNQHKEVFFYSPATQKTTQYQPSVFVPAVQSKRHKHEQVADDEEYEEGAHPMHWQLHDKSPAAVEMMHELDRDDWMAAHWIPPSVELAEDHRHETMFDGGKAPLCATGHYQMAAKLGDGISLYFRLLKSLSFMFTVMSVFAIPCIVINMEGTRTDENDVDPLRSVYTTLANFGPASGFPANVTTIVGQQMSTTVAGVIYASCDALYTLLFMLFLIYFQRQVSFLVADHKLQHASATTYTLRVRGLPRDATVPEIREHFSNLYDLSQMDWSYRGICGCIGTKLPRAKVAVDEPAPVDSNFVSMQPNFHTREEDRTRSRKFPVENVRDTSNTGDDGYQESWVAEVSLIHPYGDAIRQYLRLKSTQLKILNAKHTYLMYKQNMLDLDDKIRKKADKQSTKALKDVVSLQNKLHRITKKFKPTGNTNECYGAYVTFNEEESFQRCLEDYHRYSGASKFIQPDVLRFRGTHRLSVQRAPEPTNIMWQNLDTPTIEKCGRRVLGNLAVLLMLVVSVIVVFFAAVAQKQVSSSQPSVNLCQVQLPPFVDPAATSTNFVRYRDMDSQCPTGTFLMTLEGVNATAAFLARSNTTAPCADPCVLPEDDRLCDSTSASAARVKQIIGCYCTAVLAEAVREHGVFDAVSVLSDQESDICLSFASDFATAQALFMLSALVVVVVNQVLKVVMKKISRFERYDSLSAESVSQTRKIFIGQFLNTGVVILLVNANIPKMVFMDGLGLFEGEHDDFTPAWYSAVGTSIVLTMVLNTVAPHAMPIARWLVIEPLKRWWGKRKAASQEYLNELYEGRDFDIASRYPMVMVTLFVSLMYSGGMPLLIPLAALSFAIVYIIDKLSLLRLYNRPPRYDDRLAAVATQLMPVSLFIHLSFSIWMYSHPTTILAQSIASGSSFLADIEESVGDVSSDWWTRLSRYNVIPMVILMLVFVAWGLSTAFARGFFKSLFMVCSCGRTSLRVDAEERQALGPPFCGEYREVLSRYEAEALDYRSENMNEKDKEALDRRHVKTHGGQWQVVRMEDGDRVRVRNWVRNGKRWGVKHTQGERMKTWQVIGENSLHSYDVLKNKAYRHAVAAMMTQHPSRYNLLLRNKAADSSSDSDSDSDDDSMYTDDTSSDGGMGSSGSGVSFGSAEEEAMHLHMSAGHSATSTKRMVKKAAAELVLSNSSSNVASQEDLLLAHSKMTLNIESLRQSQRDALVGGPTGRSANRIAPLDSPAKAVKFVKAPSKYKVGEDDYEIDV